MTWFFMARSNSKWMSLPDTMKLTSSGNDIHLELLLHKLLSTSISDILRAVWWIRQTGSLQENWWLCFSIVLLALSWLGVRAPVWSLLPLTMSQAYGLHKLHAQTTKINVVHSKASEPRYKKHKSTVEKRSVATRREKEKPAHYGTKTADVLN